MNDPNVGWAVRLPDGQWTSRETLAESTVWRYRHIFALREYAEREARDVGGTVVKITRRVKVRA